MKVIVFVVIFASNLAPTSPFAEGKTRARVYQELIDARQNGLNYVTDTSYPDFDSSIAPQGAQWTQPQAIATSTENH